MSGDNSSATVTKRALSVRPLVHIAVICVLGFLAYSNTFDVPFVLDDTNNIVDNYRIRDISNIPGFFTHLEGPFASRPVMHAANALNYYFGGLNPFGYHAFNIAVHLLNVILLYLLVAMTGNHLGYEENGRNGVAALAALIFVLHPLQTETVTNVVNRSMLLATTFYFLGMMLFLKAVTVEGRRRPYIAGLFVVSLLGMGSRENFATLPIMLVLYDMCFISKFRLNEVTKHVKAYVAVLLSLGYLAFLLLGNTYDKNSLPVGVPPGEYAMTQLEVFWTYVRLIFLPINQSLEYDYPLVKSLLGFKAMISFGGYAVVWIGGFALLKRRPVMAFLLLWTVIILLPISFGVALTNLSLNDVMFEHRAYLPFVGLMVAISVGAAELFKRRIFGGRGMILLLTALMAAFFATTYFRNAMWNSEVSLLEDAIKKAPAKARPWNNKGVGLLKLGRYEEALSDFERAIEIEPNYIHAWDNKGASLFRLGRHEEALDAFDKAVQLRPDHAEAWYNRGVELIHFERYEEAAVSLERAIKLRPDYAEAWYKKGISLGKSGKIKESLAAFENALELRKDYAQAWNDRGIALAKIGRYEDALKSFERAVELNPDYEEALNRRDFVLKFLENDSGSNVTPAKDTGP